MYMYLVRLPVFMAYTCICIVLGCLCFGLYMYKYLVRLSVSFAYTCIYTLLGYMCPWLIHVYVSCYATSFLGLCIGLFV